MKKLASIAVPLIAVGAVLGTAIAGSTTLAGESTVTGGAVAALKMVRSSSGIGTDGSFVWQDVPGAILRIRVPSGTRALLVARFFAESTCVKPGDASESFCALRILIGGKEAAPGGGFNFAFDSTNQGAEGSDSGEAHAMEASRGPLRAGRYTVKLQWGVHGAGFTVVTCSSLCFFLDHWSFSVERLLVRA